MNIPSDLIDAIKKKECVLFVASGLSSQVMRSNGKKLPNWTGFLKELLEWAELKRVPFNSDPSEIHQMIQKGNHLMAAEELQEIVNVNEFGDFLNETFRDRDVKPSKSHETLTKIPFRAILTTNYDALIEGAYAISSGGQIPKSFTPADLNSAISPLRKKEFFVFKLHGDIDRPERIILGSRSYNNLLYKSPNYLSFLETLFTTQTVLFIGFGGSDPDFDYLIDRLSTIFSRTLNKHFILAPNSKFNFTEKRRLLLDKRLEVIEYDPKNDHKQVEVFIDKLHYSVNNNKTEFDNTKKNPTYVLVISSDFEEGGISNYVDNLPNFSVSIWSRFDNYFEGTEENRNDILSNLRNQEYEFKPTIIIIELTKKSLNSIQFEQEIEHALLKELEDDIILIPVIVGNLEIPFKLRNFQYVRIPENYSSKDLEALKSVLLMYQTRS